MDPKTSNLRPGGGSKSRISAGPKIGDWRRPGTRLTLCELVLELDLGLDEVLGGPRWGDGQAKLGVGVLGLEVTQDRAGLVVQKSVDCEDNVVGSLGDKAWLRKRVQG